MLKQLDLCAPYLASSAAYEVLAFASEAEVARSMPYEQTVRSAHEVVGRGAHYDSIVRTARDHCLLHGCVVWVVDRNDNDYVAFRVHPEEYTARALARTVNEPTLASA